MRIFIKAICFGDVSEGIALWCMAKGDWGPCIQEPDLLAKFGMFLHWPGFFACRLFSVSGRFDEYVNIGVAALGWILLWFVILWGITFWKGRDTEKRELI